MARSHVLSLALSLLVLAESAHGTYHISLPTEVTTASGRIVGTLEKSTKGRTFLGFYGIPYAQSPVGNLRFRDPVKASPWSGVRNGTLPAPPCLQVPFPLALKGIKLPAGQLVGSEDCLFLNVFTPRTFAMRGLPVMVFFHGGAFFAGGASIYKPDALLNHDVVLVLVQYRLGVLGFLSTEDDVLPGNYGLKDQVLALQWVQENIRNFGGDPERVTIFGQSGGGTSVHHHVLSPRSEGLFQRAIMQSGTSVNPFSVGIDHRQAAHTLGASLGCQADAGSERFLQCLQGAGAQDLAAGFQNFLVWFLTPLFFVPRVDGDFLPDDPNVLLREGRHQHVDLISGVTAHEGALGTKPLYSRPELITDIMKNPSILPLTVLCCVGAEDPMAATLRIYQHYLGGLNINDTEGVTEMMSNQLFKVSHDLATQYHSKNVSPNKKTFRYELTHRGQLSVGDSFETPVGKHWVMHSDDLFYLFQVGSLFPAPRIPGRPDDLVREDDLRLRDIMTTMWTNFATYGDPTPDLSLGFKWEEASENDLKYLDLTPNPVMMGDQRKEVRRFHASLPTSQNYIFNPELVIP
ncbi:juvenile hormone esterase-like [Penaeus indicus]|uniref:juvenile hormone esterase-like n=1 Tax=Penaeus indicus TaxID=29960 RepID=UPI00300C798F